MRKLSLAWLSLALIACDGLGTPIVDETSRGAAPGYQCIEPLLSCAQEYASQAPYPLPSAPPLPCPSSSAAPCDPLSSMQRECTLAVRVVEGTPTQLPSQLCVQLDLSPAPGSRQLVVAGLNVRGDTLTLHADAPATFVFSAAQLSASRLQVRGPVTLEFSDQSVLDGVSIESDDAVRVTVRESVARDTRVLLPAGSLRGLRASFSQSELRAREVTLETVAVSALKITSERLVGIELKGDTLQLDVVDASLSELELSRFTLDRCGSALLVNARLTSPTLEPCTLGKLHIDSSTVNRGSVRGNVESHGTLWQDSLMGAGNLPGEFQLWGDALNGNVLCPGLRRLTLSEPSTVACNDCRAVGTPESAFCSVPMEADAGVDLADAGSQLTPQGNPLCPTLDTPLPLCTPTPRSSSPF